jgi:hypothetical protein
VPLRSLLDYIDYSTEYLLLLDISTKEDRDEARQALQWSLRMLQSVKGQETLSNKVEDLRRVMEKTVHRLSGEK